MQGLNKFKTQAPSQKATKDVLHQNEEINQTERKIQETRRLRQAKGRGNPRISWKQITA